LLARVADPVEVWGWRGRRIPAGIGLVLARPATTTGSRLAYVALVVAVMFGGSGARTPLEASAKTPTPAHGRIGKSLLRLTSHSFPLVRLDDTERGRDVGQEDQIREYL
jgi:hypothetical protein